jgi:hypothetical protein
LPSRPGYRHSIIDHSRTKGLAFPDARPFTAFGRVPSVCISTFRFYNSRS